MPSKRLLSRTLWVLCGLIASSAVNTFAQTTTAPSIEQRYSRIPGVRVRAGVSAALAFQEQAFSANGPAITDTPSTEPGFKQQLLISALNVFFDMLNSLIAALQAAINNPVTPFLATVTTVTPADWTATTAVSGGIVVTEGGAAVTERGVCWSTSIAPTVADSRTTDGSGTGAFTSTITGLSPDTEYHVRAYATNSIGTAYGDNLTFRTLAGATEGLPVVSTTPGSVIGPVAANSGGNVTSDGGSAVTARGVCWSTSMNPTTADSHTTDGVGVGVFASVLTGLTPATTYYVRAYATNANGTSYGEELTITTTGG